GVSPGRVMPVTEEPLRIEGEEIPLRAEVIVNDIEQHPEPAVMRTVHQGPQIFRRSVTLVGREGEHAVVTPVPAPREIGDWHQLNRGVSDFGEMREALGEVTESALRRDGAHVQFSQHDLMPWPRRITLAHRRQVSLYDAPAGDVADLLARSRIGHLTIADV